MPETVSNRQFRFGPFEADERAGELRKHGIRLRVPGQPFQILLMLLEHPGELVTREAVRQRLWPDGTYVDFEHSLNSAVNKLRDLLNDSAARPRFIETLARRGYRFIAPVEAVPPPQETKLAPALPAQEPAVALLTSAEDLPSAPSRISRTLFLLAQLMYLSFYIGALANLPEIHQLLTELTAHHVQAFAALTTTAVAGISIRLFLLSAFAFHVPGFQQKYLRLFPLLFLLDVAWSLSPFLLLNHISIGLASAATAALLLVPFGQRTLVLMFERH